MDGRYCCYSRPFTEVPWPNSVIPVVQRDMEESFSICGSRHDECIRREWPAVST